MIHRIGTRLREHLARGILALVALGAMGCQGLLQRPSPTRTPSTGATPARQRSAPVQHGRMRIFLLVGDVDMVGRGRVDSTDQAGDAQVWMLDSASRWVVATEPLHQGAARAGVGPGRSFGIAVAERGGFDVGLVPAAVAGTTIQAWAPGVTDKAGHHPYDDAVARARAAMKRGDLAGILWHEGESDATRAGATAYEARLRALIARFRTDLGAPGVPFIMGQVGRFPRRPWDRYHVQVDSANRRIVESVPRTALVSSAGLTDAGDNLHFDARSARELGRRYAQKYFRLVETGRD